MDKDRWEGFKALACAIEQSARQDPNPNVGRLYPKSHHYLMKMTKTSTNTLKRK
ncbi:MAG: hypothetical protein ACR2LL_08725 [Nitrosopumilus sp.]